MSPLSYETPRKSSKAKEKIKKEKIFDSSVQFIGNSERQSNKKLSQIELNPHSIRAFDISAEADLEIQPRDQLDHLNLNTSDNPTYFLNVSPEDILSKSLGQEEGFSISVKINVESTKQGSFLFQLEPLDDGFFGKMVSKFFIKYLTIIILRWKMLLEKKVKRL